MTKLRQLCITSVTVLLLTFTFEAIAASASASCNSLVGASLLSNISLLASTVSSAARGPQCEEVQISKTCTATFYGKGDGFSSGTTACGNKFNPTKEKTIAIKSAANGGFFNKNLCGKKALVTTTDPRSGMTKTVEVRITDSGSMGGRSSKRCMDLSYRAANELGIVQRGVASNTTIKVCK